MAVCFSLQVVVIAKATNGDLVWELENQPGGASLTKAIWSPSSIHARTHADPHTHTSTQTHPPAACIATGRVPLGGDAVIDFYSIHIVCAVHVPSIHTVCTMQVL